MMFIENPDAFKSWLTSILEPLCDADPAALAKYVYALVKKDKPLEELRDGMLDQLDVFLQQETQPFVDMLFKSLETHEYLKVPLEPVKQATPPPQPEEPGAGDGAEAVVEGGDVAVAAPPAVAPQPPRSPPRHRVVVTRRPVPNKNAPNAQNALTAQIAQNVPIAPSAPIIRAPPMEQTLVKVLPLNELLEEPVDQIPRRRDRRSDSVRDREERRRRRSRSWERRPRLRRHLRDGEHVEGRRRPSRSPSPRGRYRNRSPPAPGINERSRSRSPVPRENHHDRDREKLRPRDLERDRVSRDRDHRDRLSRDRERDRSRSRDRSPSPRADTGDAFKRRCRDFDEKGYCMRGDLCQWDHGADPVVLEDAALSRVLTIPPPVPEYNPLAPDIWCGTPFPPYPPPHPHHALPPRELIPIPRVPPAMPRRRPDAPIVPRPPINKKMFDYTRHSQNRASHAANCSLEVKKVPRGMNDIAHLNNHFAKFGKIVNIQVCFEGDPEGALITFSSPTEANVAYKSTEAVLNNRFIKVFWHNPENKQENMAPGNNQQSNKQSLERPERPASQHPFSHNKVLINRDNTNKTVEKSKEAQQNGTAPTKPTDSPTPTNPTPTPTPTSKQEKSNAVMENYKRAQALLDTQLRQQRLMIQRLEDGNVTGAQKTALVEAINSAQEGIEKLRKELVAYNKVLRQAQVNSKKPKTREEAQKEILDAELDLFSKQQEGQDVSELMKKVTELRKMMAIQFPTHTPVIRRHAARGGRFNTSLRYTRNNTTTPPAKPFANQSVDHRPRALLISGFEADELEPLLEHFAQFGEITGKEVNLSVPELVLQYKARAHAELAALRGRHYSERTLSITWATNTKLLTPPAANGAQSDQGKDVEPPSQVSESPLCFDEEEDDEREDRSWRR